MAEIKKTVQIQSLEARVKMVEDKEEGEITDRHLITSIKFEFEGTPAQLDDVLYTLKAGHAVNVTFSSPQQALAEVLEKPPEKKEVKEEKKNPVLAGKK